MVDVLLLQINVDQSKIVQIICIDVMIIVVRNLKSSVLRLLMLVQLLNLTDVKMELVLKMKVTVKVKTVVHSIHQLNVL